MSEETRSEETSLFSRGTLQTVVAASFVVALVALVIGGYNYRQVHALAQVSAAAQQAAVTMARADGGDPFQEAAAELEALQNRVAELEAAVEGQADAEDAVAAVDDQDGAAEGAEPEDEPADEDEE